MKKANRACKVKPRTNMKKTALCPLCNEHHWIYGDYWLIPASTRSSGVSPQMIHEGFQSEFYCYEESACVVKQYSPDMKYIGYYIADEIPF